MKVLIALFCVAFAVIAAWLWKKHVRLQLSKVTPTEKFVGEACDHITFELGAYDQAILNHALQQIYMMLEHTNATIDSFFESPICDDEAQQEAVPTNLNGIKMGSRLMWLVALQRKTK